MNVKSFLLSAFLLSAFYTAHAQQPTFGLKLGANYSLFQVDNYSRYAEDSQLPIDYTGGIGFYLGGYMDVSLKDKIHFRPELIYSYRSMEQEFIYYESYTAEGERVTFTATNKINQQLVLLPLLLSYEIAPKLALEAGPQIGYVLATKTEIPTEYEMYNTFKDYDKLEFSGILGLNYAITNKITLEANFGYGFAERDEGFSNVYRVGVNYGL